MNDKKTPNDGSGYIANSFLGDFRDWKETVEQRLANLEYLMDKAEVLAQQLQEKLTDLEKQIQSHTNASHRTPNFR